MKLVHCGNSSEIINLDLIKQLKLQPTPQKLAKRLKHYRAQTQSMLSQAEKIRSGYSSQLASIAERQKIYEQTMQSRSAALTRQGEEQMAALRSQSAEERKVAAEEAAVRSANQRRAELAPRLQIQPAGETV
jgi:uncharacterized HAD superfamily protein